VCILKFELEQIRSLNPGELLDLVYNSMLEMKPIDFRKIEMNHLTKDILEPKFDDVKKSIEYNDLPDGLHIKVPVYDERDLPHYKQSIFSQKTNDLLPVTGFFVQSNVELVIKPLGLVEVIYSGFKISRNDNDFRYLRHHLVYRHTEYFCYDYEGKKYNRVPDQELEKIKFQLQKNGEAKLDSAHELVKMYLEREEILNDILAKLKVLYEEYQLDLIRFLKDNYSAGNQTISTVNAYLNRYAQFLIEKMPKGLKIKYVYSQVSRREFDELLKEAERLIEILNNGIGMLRRISELVEGYFANYELLSGPVEGSEEFEIKNSLLDLLNRDIADFKMPRPYNFNYAELMKGYIGFDLELGEIYPNIAQLENRVLLNESVQEDLQDEQDYMKKIIEFKKRKLQKT
jgi:hypothetical protein